MGETYVPLRFLLKFLQSFNLTTFVALKVCSDRRNGWMCCNGKILENLTQVLYKEVHHTYLLLRSCASLPLPLSCILENKTLKQEFSPSYEFLLDGGTSDTLRVDGDNAVHSGRVIHGEPQHYVGSGSCQRSEIFDEAMIWHLPSPRPITCLTLRLSRTVTRLSPMSSMVGKV